MGFEVHVYYPDYGRSIMNKNFPGSHHGFLVKLLQWDLGEQTDLQSVAVGDAGLRFHVESWACDVACRRRGNTLRMFPMP